MKLELMARGDSGLISTRASDSSLLILGQNLDKLFILNDIECATTYFRGMRRDVRVCARHS